MNNLGVFVYYIRKLIPRTELDPGLSSFIKLTLQIFKILLHFTATSIYNNNNCLLQQGKD